MRSFIRALASLGVGLTLLLGGASCRSPGGREKTGWGFHGGPSVSEPDRPQDRCENAPGEAPSKTLHELMAARINPRLSQLSMLIFHDRRPKDDDNLNDEIAQAAATLSACFSQVPALYLGEPGQRLEFENYAAMERFNARALSNVGYQRDHVGQLHWFVHIKETCQACHAQYRFSGAESASRGP